MTDDQLKQLAADVLNGKTDPDTIPSGWDFIKIQNIAQKLQRIKVVKEMMAVSRKRLIAQGYIELEGIGWKKRSEVPHLDLVKKNGRWFATDPRKKHPIVTENRDKAS